ncbi:glutamate--cysteine ligase [Pusillimonas sp. ANT_WB101]|uniref:glutamate--cysteine ligase n=1 Tax=Pusillimonas sp. ANT_WB101 TaxID=2597356 RepID=UPI0011ECE440|nr:glutamate--cysteine ligase [Pusillimonas sp. ANT_WB101]KAA0889282.1 glutamate--cysteine ligase [Pusillimonas sp. ANT_WB101]
MTPSNPGYNTLSRHLPVLKGILRGIEKESLRVTEDGVLAQTPHPQALGSALTHPRITTDYSESLLELITATHHSADSLLAELAQTHAYVARQLQDELMWNQSMPAHLPADADIPIAWYGTSNSGMLKHVYRRGLAVRYGKAMQCIAGVHYNFSLPDAFWDLFDPHDKHDSPKKVASDTTHHSGCTTVSDIIQTCSKVDSLTQRRSQGYLALIRNFTRYSWFLMYLFGAAPAVSSCFLRGNLAGLERLDDQTLYLPYATSLRMSDLGYQSNKAQSELQLCYNDLETFLARIYTASTTPWPDYEAIGTHKNGEWVQLNTNIIQIENEYYSSIRPKRTTDRGERPVTALAQRGVEYIEVRCLDIDPFSPLGISAQTSRFMDAFLLFCATEESRNFPQNGYCADSHNNFSIVVKEGRRPGLELVKSDKKTPLSDWATELIERIGPYADLLDSAYGGQQYRAALAEQAEKVRQPGLTPSARVLDDLRTRHLSLHEYTLQQSMATRDFLRAQPFDATTEAQYQRLASVSFDEQHHLENSDTEDFDSYVARYNAALARP